MAEQNTDPFELAWGSERDSSEHEYNKQDLDSLGFLTAVYKDQTVPLNLRMDAANYLLPFTYARPGTLHQPTITVRLPFLPGQWDPITEQDKETLH